MRKLNNLLAVALSAAIVLCGITKHHGVSAESEDEKKRIIVSLGDSYSSGEGIEDFYWQEDILKKITDGTIDKEEEKTNFYDWLAHRSEESWPGQLKLPGVSGTMSEHRNENWYFAAASGAVLNNLYYKQEKTYDLNDKYIEENLDAFDIYSVEYPLALMEYMKVKDKLVSKEELPPQLDVFENVGKGNVDYVTMTMGGNDANFETVVSAATRAGFFMARGEKILNPNALNDCLDDTWGNFYKEDGGIRANLYDAYAAIKEKAGDQAKIIVVGYPTLLDPEGSGLFPVRNNKTINENVSKFNAEIKKIVDDCRQNRNMNIYFVSVEEKFVGHEASTKVPYINKVMIFRQKEDLTPDIPSAYSVHPNKEGAKKYAEAVQAKIDELEENGIISGNIYEDASKTWNSESISKIEKITAVNTNTSETKSLYTNYLNSMSVESSQESAFDIKNIPKDINQAKYDEDIIYSEGYYEMAVPAGSYKIELTLSDGTIITRDGLTNVSVGVISRNNDIYLDGSSPNYEWYLEPSVEAEDINEVRQIGLGVNYGYFVESDYSIFKQNGKYGIIDIDGNIVVKPSYTEANGELKSHIVLIKGEERSVFCSYHNVLTKNGNNQCKKCSVLSTTFYSSDYIYDTNLKLLANVDGNNHQYDEYYVTGGGQNGRGIITSDEAVTARAAVFPADYAEDKRVTAKVRDVYGVVKGSNVLLDFMYDNAVSYKDGIAALSKNGKWGYVDAGGQVILDFKYDGDFNTFFDNVAYLPSGGYIALNSGNNGGYCDIEGNEIVPVGTFAEARPIHNGLAWVKDKKTGLWGVIKLPRTWQDIYEEKLDEYRNSDQYNNDSMFDLCDVDGNGIPELFISQGVYGGATVCVYTTDNNQLYELENFGRNGEILVSQKRKYIIGHYDHLGYITNFIHQINNTNCELIIKLEYNVIDDVYTIDDAVISKSEYYLQCQEYLTDIDEQFCGRKYDFTQIEDVL